jgi:hypothetical protein
VASTFATGTTTITGTGETFCVFRLALGAEQIEQECCEPFALSGWAWTACTVPITNTSNTPRTATALMIGLRSALIRCLLSMGLVLILTLDDHFGTERGPVGMDGGTANGTDSVRPVGRLASKTIVTDWCGIL